MSKTYSGLLWIAVAMGCSGAEADKETGAAANCETTWQVTTTDDQSNMDAFMDFSPEDLTIAAGDCVMFIMSPSHNAVEISEENYTARDATALDGGFNVGFGQTQTVAFDTPGVHYYVCQPHVASDMVGTITVE